MEERLGPSPGPHPGCRVQRAAAVPCDTPRPANQHGRQARVRRPLPSHQPVPLRAPLDTCSPRLNRENYSWSRLKSASRRFPVLEGRTSSACRPRREDRPSRRFDQQWCNAGQPISPRLATVQCGRLPLERRPSGCPTARRHAESRTSSDTTSWYDDPGSARHGERGFALARSAHDGVRLQSPRLGRGGDLERSNAGEYVTKAISSARESSRSEVVSCPLLTA